MLLVMPLLSMGLYADERRQGTLELLATSPLANSAVAVGKWAAALTITLGLILPMGLVEAIALAAADPPITPGPFLLGYVGLLLLCGAVLALGMFVSSLTRSTLVAALLTLVLLLGLWGIEGLLGSSSGPLADALAQLSLLRQYNRWVLGVFDSSSLVILLSWTLLGLVLTTQSIRALRYRRP
jgi:ABC-2 type transport system permease protein